MRAVAILVVTFGLFAVSCAPEKAPRPVSPPSHADAPGAVTIEVPAPPPLVVERRPQSRSCKCDVLGFESDGPPKGRCTWAVGPDGGGTWTGVTSAPKFTAKLVPIVEAPGRHRNKVDYVFEGEFDFACDAAWCGRQKLSILEVAELDYRVTVERSPGGPPSVVLWVTCTSP